MQRTFRDFLLGQRRCDLERMYRLALEVAEAKLMLAIETMSNVESVGNAASILMSSKLTTSLAVRHLILLFPIRESWIYILLQPKNQGPEP